MIRYRMVATCDGCGKVLEDAEAKVTDLAEMRWKWQTKWKETGVLQRPRYMATTLLYCPECADGSSQTPEG